VSAFDEIGYWSEVKLEIVREYAAAYSRILSARRSPAFYHVYIDAFAGSGAHISRATGAMVPGSPLNALKVEPPFREYHFIDIDGSKVAELKRAIGSRRDVHIYEGDCNTILIETILPSIRFDLYQRALCLLDPYGLQLDWGVVELAGQLGSIDIFINFPSMDMNRNVLWSNPDDVSESQRARMTRFWGDDSWRRAVYDPRRTLLGIEAKPLGGNETAVNAYRERLRAVAGYSNVPEALPMRNSTGAIVYYLVFASQRPVAANIVRAIFRKYRGRLT
jgi:three-Cys-motif partner protein